MFKRILGVLVVTAIVVMASILVEGCGGKSGGGGGGGGPVIGSLDATSGSGQTAKAGTKLPQGFLATVRDSTAATGGNGVPNVTVVFAVTSGGGTLSATSVLTDAQGKAGVFLTLGPTPGGNSVTATVNRPNASPFVVDFTAIGN